MAALTQMYIQGLSTRKVTAISEELCGHSLSASAISEINKKLDSELGRFAPRELESEYPYLILDARYEKLRENKVIRSRAVLVTIGIDWEGRRQVDGQSGECHQLDTEPIGQMSSLRTTAFTTVTIITEGTATRNHMVKYVPRGPGIEQRMAVRPEDETPQSASGRLQDGS